MKSTITTNKILTYKAQVFAFLAVVLGFIFLAPSFAHADHGVADTAVLQTNKASVVNGEPVELQWFLDGHVANCTISDGTSVIIDIGSPSLPHYGGPQEVVPPANASTQYVLSCTGASDSAAVAVKPTITITSDEGTTLTIDPVKNRVDPLHIRWTTSFATNCSRMWFETDSMPGNRIYTINDNWTNGDLYNASGLVLYGPEGKQPAIVESGTFYIECFNTTVNTSDVGSLHVTVQEPPPPTPVTINIWSNNSGVHPNYDASRDPIIGWARANVQFQASSNVNSCSYSAFRMSDGTPISPLPTGFGQDGRYSGGNFTALISENTTFRVTCTRPEVTIGGVVYPEDTVFEEINFTILPDGQGDRSSVPPVTALLTVNNNQPTTSPITGKATVILTGSARNTEFCETRAVRLSDFSPIVVQSWGATYRENGLGEVDFDRAVFPTEDTRFIIECRREYDWLYGTPAVQALASSSAFVDVRPIPYTDSVASVATHIYAQPIQMTPDMIINTATFNDNFTRNGILLQAPNWWNGPYDVEITFPFDHPTNGSGVYDVLVAYCDEGDGENTFTFNFPNTGDTSTWISNDPFSGSDFCNEPEHRVHKIPSVSLQDGDPINIQCTNAQPGQLEKCRIIDVFFVDAGSESAGYTTQPLDASTPFQTVSLLWYTENASTCYDDLAQPAYAPAYPFANSTNKLVHYEGSEDVSTTTTFSVSCRRTVPDADQDTTSLVITVPSGSGTVSDIGGVDAGECVDQPGGGGTGPHDLSGINTDGLPDERVRDAKEGERAGEDRYCEPSIDLAANSPSIDPGALQVEDDGATGRYEVSNRAQILNLGEGALPAGSDITYKSRLHPLNAGIIADFGILSTFLSDIGYYGDTIDAPNPYPGSEPSLIRSNNFDPEKLPFGPYDLVLQVNQDDPPIYPESNLDYSNNYSTTSISLPVPQPPMSLVANRGLVRSGQEVELTWSVRAYYPSLTCEVLGPGIAAGTVFIPADSGPVAAMGSQSATLTSTSLFQLTCTESHTGTTFTVEETVEVVPTVEES